MNTSISPKRAAVCLATLLLLNCGAGELLYNGIRLPEAWPPKPELSREPMPVPYLQHRPDVAPIDVGRQLFVDDFLIEQTTLTRTYHTATYHSASPVMKPDRSWESPSEGKPCAMVFSDGVWFDPKDSLFKMWYMAGYTTGIACATSRDGLRWDKPALDVIPGTNLVLKQSRDSNAIWLDHNEKDPARRFKMLIVKQCRDGRNGVDMYLHCSPDGIHWGDALAERWASGDRSTFFYNPFRSMWIYSIRWDDKQYGRARMYAECSDLLDGFRRLDEIGRPWTCADKLDPRHPNPALAATEPQLYNLDAVAYESLIVGLFAVWQGDPRTVGVAKEKRNEILLGFSRDGFHWHRPDRRPFAPAHEQPGAWNWGNIQSATGVCLVVGDQLYFYVSGRGEDRAKGACTTGLAVLRRDGFASMGAGEQPGTLTTRPVTFQGRHLFVNAAVAGGELRAEVLDRQGKGIEGLGIDDCVPVKEDSTRTRIQWKSGRDLSALAGQAVRFRFHLKHGSLYAFWVSPDPSGASFGYVAAGGPGFRGPVDDVGAR